MAEASQYLEISGPGDSMEIEVAISYSVSRGYAAHYGSLSYAGHPGEPAGVEDLEFEAYEVVYESISLAGAKGSPKRGQKLDLTPWLEAFIRNAIDESELIELED